MTDKPHNNLFQHTFSQRQVVKDFLHNFFPELAADLDMRTLKLDNNTYITEELAEYYADIVYSARTRDQKPVRVALLLEHKSDIPRFPHLQLLDYMQGIWRLDAQRKPTSGQKRQLTPVLPIILYHGKRPWPKRAFATHFPDVPQHIAHAIPVIPYQLIDLSQYDDAFLLQLRAGFLINTLLALKHAKDTAYVKRCFRQLFINLEHFPADEQVRNFIRVLGVYIASTTTLEPIQIIQLTEQLPKPTQDMAMTTYEAFVKQGIEQGIEKGQKEGLTIGMILGHFVSAERMLETGLPLDTIQRITELPPRPLDLLRQCVEKAFAERPLNMRLLQAIHKAFPHLPAEQLAQITRVPIDEAQKEIG